MRRSERINSEWETPLGNSFTWDHVVIEILMDIRAQLRELNGTMNCHNTRDIPVRLRAMDKKLGKLTGGMK